jgi:hypothetical protein
MESLSHNDISSSGKKSKRLILMRTLCRLFDQYRGLAKAMVGAGVTSMFWKDMEFWFFAATPSALVLICKRTKLLSRFLSLVPDYDKLFLSMAALYQLADRINGLPGGME